MARKRKRSFFRGLLYGSFLMYLFDPQLGHGRRAHARDWTLARGRRLMRRGTRAQRYAMSTVTGKAQAFSHRADAKPQPDDITLARTVESIIFRDGAVPKGQIDVNAVDGVVTLRGEVPAQSMLDHLVARTREVHGVVRVESLLHLPGQDAPMHQ